VSRYSGQIEPKFSSLHEDDDLLWVVPFRVRYIVGICGYRYAGKTAAISHLVEKYGFRLYSLSTTLRRLAEQRGISSASRRDLQDFGDAIRRERGEDHLAKLTLREIRRDQLSHRADSRAANRIVVGGFKRPEEVETFMGIEQFRLLGLDTPDATRFKRANDVGLPAHELGEQEGTLVSFEVIANEIDRRDRTGLGEQDACGQAVEEVVKLVDPSCLIDNTDSLPELYRALELKVEEFDRRYRRPRG